MTLAVVSSLTGKCLPVLLASVRCYAPHWKTVVATDNIEAAAGFWRVPHFGRNFGEAFQHAVTEAVRIYHEEERIVILNDDCVLRPDTAEILETDADFIEEKGHKIGLLVTRADIVCGVQNVRVAHDGCRAFNGPRFMGEHKIIPIDVPIPILGLFRKEVWEKHPIPPIGWMADDVWAYDLTKSGFTHFMSSAYVHHVGGETVDNDKSAASKADSRAWIRENRPTLFLKTAKLD